MGPEIDGRITNEFMIGEWHVTPLRGVIQGPEGSRRITPKAMDVLQRLARHAGEAVERDTFLAEVRPIGTTPTKAESRKARRHLRMAALDEATELDDGNPVEFGELCADMRLNLPARHIVGGCCGTDRRHVGEACRALQQ